MGVDVLDITFRLEKAFEIRLPYKSFLEEVYGRGSRDVQVGRFHECVCRRLTEQGRKVPHSSWHRVQKCVVDAIGAKVRTVTADAWLGKDLGCS